jgi:hypothetical protein
LIIDLGSYWLPPQHFAAKVDDQGLASTDVTAHARACCSATNDGRRDGWRERR